MSTPTVVNDYQLFMKHRWLSVYGASVAVQVQDRINRGDIVDRKAMRRIKKEAGAIADLDAAGDNATGGES